MLRARVIKHVPERVPRKFVRPAIRAAFEAEGREAKGEINVVFVGEEEIRKLCREFRGEDRITDVLSFPYSEGEEVVGDIVICLPQARRQAEEAGWSLAEEVALLCIHGTLHLLGHEDKTPQGRERMRRKERKALRLLGIEPERGGVK